MKAFWTSANGQLTLGLVLVAGVFAAFAAGGDAGFGLVTAALVLAFLLLVYFGRRRSDTLDVMSGIGDERDQAALHARGRLLGHRDVVRAADLVAGDGRPGRPQRGADLVLRDLRRHLRLRGRRAGAAVVESWP